MPFTKFSKAELIKARDGIYAKVISGERLQMARIHLEHGVETNHSHPHEQMGYILSGQVEITIGNEKKSCSPGDAYHIQSNVQHGFRPLATEGVDYLEVFSPPKEENRHLSGA